MTIYTVAKAILRTLFVLFNNLYAIPTYLVWMAILKPLLINHPGLFNKIEGLGYSWLLHFVASWIWTGGYTLAECGDDVTDLVDSECLVICNHQSTADVPMLMYLCTNDSKPCLARNIYWIMDVLFKYTNFGWVSSVHGDFYIRQGQNTRQTQLIELKSHLQQVYIPRDRKWILLFPEGGFFWKRKESSQAYARKHGYPILEHVTLPRIGAVQTIMQTLSPVPLTLSSSTNNVHAEANSFGDSESIHLKKEKHLKWIIDITIAYPKGKPLDLLRMVFGSLEPCQTVMHFRRYRAEDVAQTEDALLKWLYDRWVEKDQLLAHFYETGKFPVLPISEGIRNDRLKTLSLKWQWYSLLNVLFFLSTCLHLYIIFAAVSAFLD